MRDTHRVKWDGRWINTPVRGRFNRHPIVECPGCSVPITLPWFTRHVKKEHPEQAELDEYRRNFAE